METKKEEKKGFWASLFGLKPCRCFCGENAIMENGNQAEAYCRSESNGTIKEVKILGTGCSKCKAAYMVVEKVVKDNNLDTKITKIEDMAEILNYNVIGTPAIVVDEVVKIKGRVPSESEIKQILGI